MKTQATHANSSDDKRFVATVTNSDNELLVMSQASMTSILQKALHLPAAVGQRPIGQSTQLVLETRGEAISAR